MTSPRPEWEHAQVLEQGFWQHFFTERNGQHEVMANLDYGHNVAYLPFVARHIGFRLPGQVVVEVGCGPCGLAPWLHCCTRYGVDPLRDFYAQWVNYSWLGYDHVYDMQAESITSLPKRPNLVMCLNGLDHFDDVPTAIGAMAGWCQKDGRLFLAYDMRFRATALHPSVVMPPLTATVLGDGWELLAADSVDDFSREPDAVAGRRLELWVKRR